MTIDLEVYLSTYNSTQEAFSVVAFVGSRKAAENQVRLLYLYRQGLWTSLRYYVNKFAYIRCDAVA